jgi:hypothetical protein
LQNYPTSQKSKQKMKSKPVTALLLPDLPVPGITMGQPFPDPNSPSELNVHGVHCLYFPSGSWVIPYPQAYRPSSFNIESFLRMLAKIAHGYAVAELGLDNLTSWLPDIILGTSSKSKLQYLIGAADKKLLAEIPPPQGLDQQDPPLYTAHQVRLLRSGLGISVAIRLFAFHKVPPLYHVVVGIRS